LLIDVLRRERLAPGAQGLDLGTGSGVLAIAAAQSGCSTVLAVDVSRRALLAVRLNGALNGVRIRSRRGDLYQPVSEQRFDLIVSNPPYVPTPGRGELPRRGLSRAWEGGPDGRALVDRVCRGAAAHLRPGGVMLLVHSAVCGEQATLDQLTAQGLQAGVALRHHGPLGPILRARAEWLRGRGLLPTSSEDEGEEMLVIRAQAPTASHPGPPPRAAGEGAAMAAPSPD
jgi:release factor glutamine methyltransferase